MDRRVGEEEKKAEGGEEQRWDECNDMRSDDRWLCLRGGDSGGGSGGRDGRRQVTGERGRGCVKLESRQLRDVPLTVVCGQR